MLGHPSIDDQRVILLDPIAAGYPGGVYNPGAFVHEGRIYLLARAEQYGEEERMFHLRRFLGTSTPLLIRLDDTLHAARTGPLHPRGLTPPRSRIEDFRAFPFEGRVWVNHPLHWVRAFHLWFKWERSYIRYHAVQYLSRLSEDLSAIEAVGPVLIDRPRRRIEKNWVYFEHRGELVMLYSFLPFVALKMVDPSRPLFHTFLSKRLRRPSFLSDYFVGYSINPVRFEGGYLTLVHTRDRRGGNIVRHWAVLIDGATLLPRRICRSPLFEGGAARGPQSHVLYVTSCVERPEGFVFFMGEGDFYPSMRLVGREKLLEMFEDSEEL